MIGLPRCMQAQKKTVPEISPKDEVLRPNIDHLIKRIINERRQRKKTNIISLGTALLSFTLIFYFFQN